MMDVDEYWYKQHDLFNLIVLPFILFVNIRYLVLEDGHLLKPYCYWDQFVVFFLYILIDTIWLIYKPRSVPSPKVIIAHHSICLIGWSLPAFYSRLYAEWISYGVLVELNTWFLIARRNYKSISLFSYAFYITWIVLRLFMFPFHLIHFTYSLYQRYAPVLLSRQPLLLDDPVISSKISPQELLYVDIFLWLAILALNSLNLKWTIEMGWKQLKGWWTGETKELTVKKGL